MAEAEMTGKWRNQYELGEAVFAKLAVGSVKNKRTAHIRLSNRIWKKCGN